MFTENGLCVGAASLQSSILNLQSSIGLAVWADDPTTPEVDGAAEGERLAFRVWDGKEERSVECRVQSAELGQAGTPVLLFRTDGFAEVTLESARVRSPALPTRLELYGAYPNPFNSTTLIRFDMPEAGSVSLKAFDLAGREVENLRTGLAGGPYAAGSYSVAWNAEGLPTGIYLIRLETPFGNRISRAILIR